MRRVASEDAEGTLWRLLSKYSYPTNISQYYQKAIIAAPSIDVIESASGCMHQAQAYFAAFTPASLHISPLLLYYGVVNLLYAASVLKTGSRLSISNHGIKLSVPPAYKRIGDVELAPCNPLQGALQLFTNALSPKPISLVNGSKWTLVELLGMIPDLLHDFENCYAGVQPHVLPVEVVRTRRNSIERIALKAFWAFSSPAKALLDVEGLSGAYLAPQATNECMILRPKMNSTELGCRSISGRKYLPIGYRKGKSLVTLDLLTAYFMGLFAFGFLSRYHPEVWNPFVRSDATGERLVVERFLATAKRQVPNLVLSLLEGEEVRIVNESEGLIDMTSTLTDADLKDAIDRQIRQHLLSRM